MAPFKSSLARSTGKLFGVFKENDLSLRGSVQSTRFISSQRATGGIIETGATYTYHIFTDPGSSTFEVLDNTLNVDYFIVGGGGGGGGSYGGSGGGGGGGAGGVRSGSSYPLSPNTSYPVVVGDGKGGNAYPVIYPAGPGAPNLPSWVNGEDSSFNSIVAAGGGKAGGGPAPEHDGSNGGSGGGAGYDGTGGNGNTPPTSPPQGNNGGTASSTHRSGGGGGGAGGVGADNLSPNTGGDGGVGIAAFSGDTELPASYGTPGPSAGRWFGGGGGGGAYSIGSKGTGGAGGGGNGGGGGSAAQTGTTNTGGGGGGIASNEPGVLGATGGPGIVIIRYLT
jgi:hypothetical protein